MKIEPQVERLHCILRRHISWISEKRLGPFRLFLHAAFIYDEKECRQVSFWCKNYKGFSEGGRNLKITIIFVYCLVLWNLEQYSSVWERFQKLPGSFLIS